MSLSEGSVKLRPESCNTRPSTVSLMATPPSCFKGPSHSAAVKYATMPGAKCCIGRRNFFVAPVGSSRCKTSSRCPSCQLTAAAISIMIALPSGVHEGIPGSLAINALRATTCVCDRTRRASPCWSLRARRAAPRRARSWTSMALLETLGAAKLGPKQCLGAHIGRLSCSILKCMA